MKLTFTSKAGDVEQSTTLEGDGAYMVELFRELTELTENARYGERWMEEGKKTLSEDANANFINELIEKEARDRLMPDPPASKISPHGPTNPPRRK